MWPLRLVRRHFHEAVSRPHSPFVIRHSTFVLFGAARLCQGSEGQAEHHLDHGGRSRLCRSRLLWSKGHHHTAPRPHGERRAALHPFLLRCHRLRTFTQRAHDWLASRPHSHPRQCRPDKPSRTGSERRRCHRGVRFKEGGLQNGSHRQMGPRQCWRSGERTAAQAWLRLLLRLPEPAPRAQSLPRLPLAQ